MSNISTNAVSNIKCSESELKDISLKKLEYLKKIEKKEKQIEQLKKFLIQKNKINEQNQKKLEKVGGTTNLTVTSDKMSLEKFSIAPKMIFFNSNKFEFLIFI